jgi:hypothetical protein
LNEGVTICHPEKIHNDFKIFSYNTNGEVLSLYSEKNNNHGRILVDCGFTKLYKEYWNTAGTPSYVAQANAWIAGIDI